MKKQTATRWYVGAWAACVVAICSVSLMDRGLSPDTAPPAESLAYLVVLVATIVMLITWIAALFDLERRRRWVLLAIVVLTQIVFLGIAGMLAYALFDRRSRPVDVAVRPALT